MFNEPIQLNDIPCFKSKSGVGQSIGPFGQVAFIFGRNGSGKTSFVKKICELYKQEFQDKKLFVYDREYIQANIADNPDQPLKGIFTIGFENVDAKQDLKSHKDKESKFKTTLTYLDKEIDEVQKNQREAKSELQDNVWNVSKNDRSLLDKALEGLKGSKEKLVRALHAVMGTESSYTSIDDLKKDIESAWIEGGGQVTLLPRLCEINFLEEEKSLLENPLFSTKSTDFSRFIEKHRIRSWVEKGQEYLSSSEGACPFCQQPIPPDLERNLNVYFNEELREKTLKIVSIKTRLEDYHEQLSVYKKSISYSKWKDSGLTSSDLYAKEQKLINAVNDILLVNQGNIRKLQEKLEDHTKKIKIDSISEGFQFFERVRSEINEVLEKHNKIFQSKKEFKEKLKEEVRRFIISHSGIKVCFDQYDKKAKALEKREGELKKRKEEKSTALTSCVEMIDNLEKKITSAEPIAKIINDMCKQWGFKSFQIQTEGGSEYKLVREDGTDVAHDLSEGERTFLTFLYFYHSVKSQTKHKDIVVVVDDPVSSLDSEMLHAVQMMIQDLKPSRGKECSIQKVVVLTHNTYFWKEITYDKNKGYSNDKKHFWTLNKTDDGTNVQSSNNNPIASDYELLWCEVINAKKAVEDNEDLKVSSVSLQNTLRRILEIYFNFKGDFTEDPIFLDMSDSQIKQVKALCSWINANSHNAIESLYASDTFDIRLALKCFEIIFERSNELGHYNRMMNKEV